MEKECVGVVKLLQRVRDHNPALGQLVECRQANGELIVTLTNGVVKCSALMAADEETMPNCVPDFLIKRIAENFRPN